MTEDNIELTRRQILASTGAVGLAGAGAGLGTSALFSDDETFERNTIAAGEFDLKVDWKEHYFYPQLYGFDDPTDGLEFPVHRSEPGEDGYVGIPDPVNPMVWVHDEDVPAYMANTAIEAFPDPNNDGQQELSGRFEQYPEFDYEACADGADLPMDYPEEFADLDPSYLRTDNADTRTDDETPAPLVNLDDVKPGDFGEFTLSFHLCDNPGKLWLRGANVSESENGLTEPESEVDETPDDAELAENIRTAWWYDPNGNNVIDESVGEADVMLAVDTSGSLSQGDVGEIEAFANSLAADLDATGNVRVGGLSFGNGSIDNFESLSGGPVSFSGLDANGNTPMPAALDVAAAELDANGRPGAETFIIMFSDGGPNYPNDGYGEFPIGGGFTPDPYQNGDPSNSVVEDDELCETAGIADTIRADHRILALGINDDGQITNNPGAEDCDGNPITTLRQYLRDYIAGSAGDYYSAQDISDIGPLLDDVLENVATEEKAFHRGNLADDLDLLSSGNGIPLDGDFGSDFDELEDPPGERACFDPGATYYVGFAWWLPLDVGNEVQSDSLQFNLGFGAEQCRNNGDA